MEDWQGKQSSEQVDTSAVHTPRPEADKSSDRTQVNVANIVSQDSTFEQSHQDSTFIAIDSSSNCPQQLLENTDVASKQDSEEARTSTLGAASPSSGDCTQVGTTLAFAQKDATVIQQFHDTTIITGNLPQHLFDTNNLCDEAAALSLAQSKSKITQRARSTLHMKKSPQSNEDIDSSRDEAIKKLFREAIGEWNSILCGTQDNLISKIEKLLSKDSREIFSMMVEILNYFMRDKKSLEIQYRRERTLAFEDDSQQSNRPVTYKKLLDLIVQATPRHLVIVGPAGAGKSTLLRRICRDLSADENNISSQKLIIFLNFRDLHSEEKITPCELLFHGLFRDQSLCNECYDWLLKNQDKVIFLLDGLDQARFSVSGKAKLLRDHSKGSASDIISNILSRKLFPKSKIVYSSREHSVSSLEDSLRPDKVISLTGFSYDDAEYLFTNAVGNGKDLWTKMESSVKALVTIPVFLTFMIFVYICNPDSPPSSMTEIMQKLFEGFMLSENVLNRDESGKISTTTLNGLRELSFVGLCEKKLSFNIKNFHKVGLNLQEVRDFVIIVLGQPSSNLLPTFCVFEGYYVIFFTHQSIQEFFAAEYIVQMDLKSFNETVDRQLRNDDWSVVTRFVSGILLNEKLLKKQKISDLPDKQEILKRMLKSKYDGGQGLNLTVPTLSTLASMAETEDRDFIQCSVKDICVRYHPIGISGISSIASVMRHCSHLESLQLHGCGLDDNRARFLWENIKHSSVKINILDASANNKLGNGFQHICKVAAHCNVQELRVPSCNLPGDQISCLKEIKSSQLRLLNLYDNNVSEASFADIGAVIADGGELFLPKIAAAIASGIQRLERALSAKKLKGLHIGMGTYKPGHPSPRIYVKKETFPDTFFVSLGNIMAHGGSLTLRNFIGTYSGLQRLMLALDRKKISKLDYCDSNFDTHCRDADCCFDVIGKIVTSCSIDSLVLCDCGITDDALDNFLSDAKGAKLTKLNLRSNYLSQAAIQRIGENITVEKLMTEYQEYQDILNMEYSQ